MVKQHAVKEAVLFSAVTLGLSYFVFWGPLALFGVPAISFVKDTRGPLWAILLFLLGGFVPSGVALVQTALREGRSGVKALLRRCVQFRLGLRWYLTIVVVVLLGTAGQIALNSLLGHRFDFGLFLRQLQSFLPLLVIGAISEELGWRGYLLPRLQDRLSALASSVLVGIVWALWHLPLFFLVGTSQNELDLPFTGFLVGLVAISIIMTWLNNGTSCSLWTAILFHWLYTYASQVVASGVTRSVLYNGLEYVPYAVIALLVLLIWTPRLQARAGGAANGPARSAGA